MPMFLIPTALAILGFLCLSGPDGSLGSTHRH